MRACREPHENSFERVFGRNDSKILAPVLRQIKEFLLECNKRNSISFPFKRLPPSKDASRLKRSRFSRNARFHPSGIVFCGEFRATLRERYQARCYCRIWSSRRRLWRLRRFLLQRLRACDFQRLQFNSRLKNELNAKKVALPSGGARAAQSPSKPQTESASLNRGTAEPKAERRSLSVQLGSPSRR